MSNLKRSSVCVKNKDLKEEEVQVHSGIRNRGCLAYTGRHPLTSTHKHTRTLSHVHTLPEQMSHPSPKSTHSPISSSKKQSFPPAKLKPDHNWVCAFKWVYWILLYCCIFVSILLYTAAFRFIECFFLMRDTMGRQVK